MYLLSTIIAAGLLVCCIIDICLITAKNPDQQYAEDREQEQWLENWRRRKS